MYNEIICPLGLLCVVCFDIMGRDESEAFGHIGMMLRRYRANTARRARPGIIRKEISMKRRIISVIALTLCALIAALSFTACGGKNELIGSWDSVEAPGSVYTFEEGGSGNLNSSGMVMNFTYTTGNGKISITYEGSTSAQTVEYSIKGSVLTLTDPETGSTLTYNKK